jgi:hypothetical protein
MVFWPAAFFVGGNGQTAAELAQLKGELVAIEQACVAEVQLFAHFGMPLFLAVVGTASPDLVRWHLSYRSPF